MKRLVARELTLSFVPGVEQRLWRTVARRKYQLTRDHVRLQNQLESLLEEAHIKLSSLVSNLLGASARRMLKALAEGETNPAALAALADQHLRATPEQLCDALGACTDLKPVYRRLLKMMLEQLQFLEQQIGQLDQEMAADGTVIMGWEQAASGYAGVWATDNTRQALFDAMQRKVVYATTGPRMIVRFFGGWDFDAKDALSRNPSGGLGLSDKASCGSAGGLPLSRCGLSQGGNDHKHSYVRCALRRDDHAQIKTRNVGAHHDSAEQSF